LFTGLGFAAILSAVQTWIVEVLQRRVFVRMVGELAVRLPRVAIGAYDRSYGPELVNRFFDIVTIQKVGSTLLLDGLSILLSVLVGLVVLAFYHPLLLAFDIVLLAAIALIVIAGPDPAVTPARGPTASEPMTASLDVSSSRPFAVFPTDNPDIAIVWLFDEEER
jgi:ABC-type bacteriocin/lantibiotic exporter with double-glycine peptidase domain